MTGWREILAPGSVRSRLDLGVVTLMTTANHGGGYGWVADPGPGLRLLGYSTSSYHTVEAAQTAAAAWLRDQLTDLVVAHAAGEAEALGYGATPAAAAAVLHRLTVTHAGDSEAVDALVLAQRRLALREGRGFTSVELELRAMVPPGTDSETMIVGRPWCMFKPVWLDLLHRAAWRITRWCVADQMQPVAPLLTGGRFATCQRGQDVIFYVRNLTDAVAEFDARLVGYGYQPKETDL